MTRAVEIASVDRRTGKAWRDWLASLETIGVHDLAHNTITRRVREECGFSGWWTQSMAVAYGQHVDRHVPGQQCDSGFQVSVIKTFPGSMYNILASWQAAMEGYKALAGTTITRAPVMGLTDKWRYWRCSLADSSRASVGIGNNDNGKAALGVGHERLVSSKAVECWRAF